MNPLPSASATSWPRRFGWFVLIWSASVFALAVVAGVLRLIMTLAGLTE